MLLQAQSMSASHTLSRIYDDPALLADAFQQLEYETIVLQQMPAHREILDRQLSNSLKKCSEN